MPSSSARANTENNKHIVLGDVLSPKKMCFFNICADTAAIQSLLYWCWRDGFSLIRALLMHTAIVYVL